MNTYVRSRGRNTLLQVLLILLYWLHAVTSFEFSSYPVLDLLSLVKPSRMVAGPAMAYIPGSDGHSKALLLSGRYRQLQVSPEHTHRVEQLLSTSHDGIMILGALKQVSSNSGTIVSLSTAQGGRCMELESLGRRDKIRFSYKNGDHMDTQSFSYELADNRWHKIAMGINRTHLVLFIDCHKIYERIIRDVDLSCHAVDIWLAQRNSRRAYFKGALEYVKLVGSSQGIELQCPHLSSACPVPGELEQLEHSVQSLIQQLHAANLKNSLLESCECEKTCDVNGTLHRDGETWETDKCTTCTCNQGKVNCDTVQCPEHDCLHPTALEGHCCPVCKPCYYSGDYYDHGERFNPRACVSCLCQDGIISCDTQNPNKCPALQCPPEDQFYTSLSCCRMCRDADFCSQGHQCHANATCHNLHTGYSCRCKLGFSGNGYKCYDIDECALHHDHCHGNAVCVNTVGSYKCKCKEGYKRIDRLACTDEDECTSGKHNCSENAICTNTPGSYQCSCNEGYSGNGTHCSPLDECSHEDARCDPSKSFCVNLINGYTCQCLPGYQSISKDDGTGSKCTDKNECTEFNHNCSLQSNCYNINGGFQCRCKDEELCRPGCSHQNQSWDVGKSWEHREDRCILCRCNSDGIVTCEHPICNCSDPHVDLTCCKECKNTHHCEHQVLPHLYLSGESWIHDCQTCHCKNGHTECYPLRCPTPQCSNPLLVDGECCPKCIQSDPCRVFASKDLDVSAMLGNDELQENVDYCTHYNQRYSSGEFWRPSQHPCSSCICKNGNICCVREKNCKQELLSLLFGHRNQG